MMKKIALSLAALFWLAACQSVPDSSLPELRYTHLTPLNLNVGAVEVVSDYKAPLKAPNVDHTMPVSPGTAFKTWVNDRVKAVGQNYIARFVIKDASVVEVPLAMTKGLKGVFTTDQSERYDARLDVVVDLIDATGGSLGSATTQVTRSITVPEDSSLNDREKILFETTEALMVDLNKTLESKIRSYLGTYVR